MIAVAILAALREELAALSLASPRREPLPEGPAYAVLGNLGTMPVALAATGTGREAARRATRALLQAWRPQVVLSLGFGGGLQPGLRAGALVLSPRIWLEAGAEAAPLVTDAGLATVAAEALVAQEIPFHTGDCLTVEGVVASPQRKAALGTEREALVVDMESYWVAWEARGLGIPFVALRAVVDPVEQALPPFVGRAHGHGARHWLAPALAYALSSPGGIPHLARLGMASRRASRALAQAASAVAPTLVEVAPLSSGDPGLS